MSRFLCRNLWHRYSCLFVHLHNPQGLVILDSYMVGHKVLTGRSIGLPNKKA
jgi:hypothetical protein